MSIREIILDCYAAYAARDFEATMRPFAENISFEWPADQANARFSGCHKGKEAMVDRLVELSGQFEFLDVQALELLVDGDRASAEVAMKLKSNHTGKEITVISAHYWFFEDEECVRFIEIYDTALVQAHIA